MKSTWTVKGTLEVEHGFTEVVEAFGAVTPLVGIEVKVSAREKILGVWGPWNSWGTTRTNADGAFSIAEEKDQSARQFKVEVLFKDDRLKIYPDNESVISSWLDTLLGWNPITSLLDNTLESVLENTSRLTFDVKWITVHDDKDAGIEREAGAHQITGLTFRPGAKQELGDRVPHRHAQIWDICHRIFELFDSFEGDVGFDPNKTLAIKYPHQNPQIDDRLEVSYANPQTNQIFVVENSYGSGFSLRVLIHELMHLLDYQNTTGELGMAWQLAVHGTTHGRQEEPWVAGKEGFAQWAYYKTYQKLFGLTPTGQATKNTLSSWYVLPFSRSYLQRIGITDQTEIEHHEKGWISLFNMLTTQNLHECDFNSPETFAERIERLIVLGGSCDNVPDTKFADLLRVFKLDSSAGYPHKLANNELTKNAFLARACAILRLGDEVERAYQILLNPQHDATARDLLCTGTPIRPPLDLQEADAQHKSSS